MSSYYETEIMMTIGGLDIIVTDNIVASHYSDVAEKALSNSLFVDECDIKSKIDDYLQGYSQAIECEDVESRIHIVKPLVEAAYTKEDGSAGSALIEPLSDITRSILRLNLYDDLTPYQIQVKKLINEREINERQVIWALDDQDAFNRALINNSFDFKDMSAIEETIVLMRQDDGSYCDSAVCFRFESINKLPLVEVNLEDEPRFFAALVSDVHWTNTSQQFPKRDLLKLDF